MVELQLLWTSYLDDLDFHINYWAAVGDIYGAFVPGYGN